MSCRKQQSFSLGLFLTGAFLFGTSAWAASTLTAIDFTGTQDPNQLSIQADGPITVTQQNLDEDRQIILEISNATLPKSLARRIDTSSFDGNISLISPYQVEGRPDTVRIVLQLREPGTATLNETGNSATLLIPRMTGTAMVEAPSTAPTPPELDETPTAPEPPAPQPAAPAAEMNDSGKGSQVKQLDAFLEARNTNRFSGKPITLQVRDVDVVDVFRLIAEASGFNIVLGEDVKGRMTLALTDVPWDQALDVVLRTLHLGAERNHNILRVVTLESLTMEKVAEIQAKKAAEAATPRITKVFPISYANLKDLAALLSKFTSSGAEGDTLSVPVADQGAQPGGVTSPAAAAAMVVRTGQGNNAPVVQIDSRTNSLVVRDVPENIERMQKLIAILDTQTPQVMIEAKVVEATESFSRQIGGNIGAVGEHGLAGYGTNQIVGLANGGGFSDLVGRMTSEEFKTTNGGAIGFSPTLSFVSGFRLNAILQYQESDSKVKVVSSPKTVVLNKELASIVSSTPVLLPKVVFAKDGTPIPTTEVVDANLGLDVRPTITNEGGVLMDLKISRDTPVSLIGGGENAAGIGKRNMNTTVLVESGSTLVIGGIYTSSANESSGGFPFLRKIPIIGTFFGTDASASDRSELFIFVTPRILNPKEAGLSG